MFSLATVSSSNSRKARNSIIQAVSLFRYRFFFEYHEILETLIKQLLDEVEHDIMNYQNRGLRYLPKPSASADNTDTRF